MSHSHRSLLFAVTAALIFPAAAGAQSLAPDEAAVAALPPPMSITQRYVPAAKKTALAPLTLLVDDSSPVVAAADIATPAPQQPVIVEEVGDRPAIAALAPGRMAITVSNTTSTEGRHDPRPAVLFQNGRPLPPVRR